MKILQLTEERRGNRRNDYRNILSDLTTFDNFFGTLITSEINCPFSHGYRQAN